MLARNCTGTLARHPSLDSSIFRASHRSSGDFGFDPRLGLFLRIYDERLSNATPVRVSRSPFPFSCPPIQLFNKADDWWTRADLRCLLSNKQLYRLYSDPTPNAEEKNLFTQPITFLACNLSILSWVTVVMLRIPGAVNSRKPKVFTSKKMAKLSRASYHQC